MVQAFAPHAADQAFPHTDFATGLRGAVTTSSTPHRRHGRAERLPVCVQSATDAKKRSDLATRQTNRQSDQPGKRVRHAVKPNQFLRLTASALIREATASDSGGPGAAGGGATGGRRRTRAQARPGPQPQGGAALQARLWRTRPEGAEQLHDTESRIMKTNTEGFQQCYNAQTVVDGAH